MQNSIWKLTALAGVIGIGVLAVLQIQRGLSNPDPQNKNAASQSSEEEDADAPPQSNEPDVKPSTDDAPLVQNEPQPTPVESPSTPPDERSPFAVPTPTPARPSEYGEPVPIAQRTPNRQTASNQPDFVPQPTPESNDSDAAPSAQFDTRVTTASHEEHDLEPDLFQPDVENTEPLQPIPEPTPEFDDRDAAPPEFDDFNAADLDDPSAVNSDIASGPDFTPDSDPNAPELNPSADSVGPSFGEPTPLESAPRDSTSPDSASPEQPTPDSRAFDFDSPDSETPELASPETVSPDLASPEPAALDSAFPDSSTNDAPDFGSDPNEFHFDDPEMESQPPTDMPELGTPPAETIEDNNGSITFPDGPDSTLNDSGGPESVSDPPEFDSAGDYESDIDDTENDNPQPPQPRPENEDDFPTFPDLPDFENDDGTDDSAADDPPASESGDDPDSVSDDEPPDFGEPERLNDPAPADEADFPAFPDIPSSTNRDDATPDLNRPEPVSPETVSPDLPDRSPRRPEPNRLPEPPRTARPADADRREPVEENVPPRPSSTVRRATQQPQLKIEKVAPPNAVLGRPMIYEIHVRNIGESVAHQVVVEDRIPKGARLSGTNPQAELVNDRLRWKLGSLKPGAREKIAVRIIPLSEGSVGSVATVNFVAEVEVATEIVSSQLSVKLDAPNQVAVGQKVPVRFRVKNVGTRDATGVIIRDLVPEGLHHDGGNDLEYELGTLPAGTTRDITLTLLAVKPGKVTNRTIITADGGINIEDATIVEINKPKLVIRRTGPKHRYIGRTAVYSNSVVNESDEPLTNVIVSETIPEQMEFVEATAGGRFDSTQNQIHWRIPRIEPGERIALGVRMTPRRSGDAESVVTAEIQGASAASIRSQTKVEGFTTLALDVPPIDNPVDVGDRLAVRIVARNRGTGDATNTKLTVTVPAELDVVSARGPNGGRAVLSGREVRFDAVRSITKNSDETFEIILTAKKPGDVRIGLRLKSDQMSQPVGRDEAVLILDDGR